MFHPTHRIPRVYIGSDGAHPIEIFKKWNQLMCFHPLIKRFLPKCTFWAAKVIKVLYTLYSPRVQIHGSIIDRKIYMYRDSPVSAVFWSPANRTIGKTALTGDWFSTKIAIWDFWIFKVPFLAHVHKIISSFWHVYWVIYHKLWL